MEFKKFNQLLRQRFSHILSTSPALFVVDVRRGAMWDHYISSFQDAEERQSFNCNCCRSFLNKYSTIVGIDPTTYETMPIWDLPLPDEAELYQPAVQAMLEEVSTSKIRNPLVTRDTELGLERSPGTTWHHFSLNLPSNLVHMSDDTEDSVIGRKVGMFNSMRRMFKDWTPSLVELVLDLIEEGKINRADQFKTQLIELKGLVLEYEKVPLHLRDNFVWLQVVTKPHLDLKNLSIGVLFKYLLEDTQTVAISKYNKATSAENYQRTTSAPSETQLQRAKQKFEDLGYLPSLKRRLANINDIPVTSCVFLDRTAGNGSTTDESDPFAGISTKSSSTGKRPKGKPIGIEAFINDVLPTATSLQIFAEGQYLPNLATFTAPIYPDAPNIFAWDNPIGFAFIGDAAGATTIREKVKKAGGKVEGILRVSLSWGKGNTSDYDLALKDPAGDKIFFGRKKGRYGELDIDANFDVMMDEPVENIIYEHSVPEGEYEVYVTIFKKRREIPKGYTVEVCNRGESHFITSTNTPDPNEEKCCSYTIDKDGKLTDLKVKAGLTLSKKETITSSNTTLWGVESNTFHKVSHMILSPNYWGDRPQGNKQYFFILPNCQVKEGVRPFFKEFIRGDLREEFGKVFEGLGAANMIQPSADQLSGLGFSATDGKVVIFKVDGKTYEVSFNYKERFKKEEEEENGQSSINSQSSSQQALV